MPCASVVMADASLIYKTFTAGSVTVLFLCEKIIDYENK
jgi:hypothetical protein